jgi:SAM-dependent methyltransferase
VYLTGARRDKFYPLSTRAEEKNAEPKIFGFSYETSQNLKLEERMTDGVFAYKGYEIPSDLVYLTGAGPDTFDIISQGHIALLQDVVGLNPHFNVLEIGCGIGRDAIPLTDILSEQAVYLGIDIIKPSIDWCSNSITARHPNFRFIHFDIKDQLTNPHGEMKLQDYSIPVDNNSIDRIILWSVFTHMFRDDIVYYLKEFRRVLKPSGLVFATCFIVNDEVLSLARATGVTSYNLKFQHEYGKGCYVNDLGVPAGAVAYTVETLYEIVAEGELQFERPFLFGNWAGLYQSVSGQDVMFLKRPNPGDAAGVEAGFRRDWQP